MMKKNTISAMIFGLVITPLITLSACQRQESSENILGKTPTPVSISSPQVSPTPEVAISTSIVDNPEIRDLLNQVVRPDIPSMSFDQKNELFPSTCVVNDNNFTITCPGVAGLVLIRTDNGPDGSLSLVFSGGMSSCKTIGKLVSQKFGMGVDISDQNIDGVCDITWQTINPKNKRYHASLGKLKGDDEGTLLIDADDPVGP
jgi:hypothetical protein